MAADPHLAVITGGSGCLGRAIAAALQDPDWLVEAPGSHELDVTDPDAVDAYFRNRAPQLLVCAAGVTRDAPLSRLAPEAWDQTWAVNYLGARRCARAAIPHMVRRGSGHIVFISSFSALRPPVGQAVYASAKAALLGLVTDLASQFGAANLRVNAILPGFLETKMTATVSERRKEEVLSEHALGRFNTCGEVAAFVRFLHHGLPHTSGQFFQLDSRTKNP